MKDNLETLMSMINLLNSIQLSDSARFIYRCIQVMMILAVPYVIYLSKKRPSNDAITSNSQIKIKNNQVELQHSKENPSFEIKVDNRTAISVKTDNYIKGPPTLQLNISFIPNQPMIFTKLFLKIEDEEIEPLTGSIYVKQLQLPLNINQLENYNINFHLSTKYGDKELEGKILAVVNGVDWMSDVFKIGQLPLL